MLKAATVIVIVSAAVIIPIISIALHAIVHKSTISQATNSETTKNELLGKITKAIEQIDIHGPLSMFNHKKEFPAYHSDESISAENSHNFNLLLMTNFLESLELILQSISYDHKLSITTENTLNQLLNGDIRSKEFIPLISEDILQLSQYHLGSDTPLKALQNQRIFLEISTALLQSFNETKQIFNDNKLLMELTKEDASRVRDNFIEVKVALNEMTEKISELFTNTSSPINYQYFRDWMNGRIVYSFGEAFFRSFPGFINKINEKGGLAESINLIEIDNRSEYEQKEIALFNDALQKFIKELIGAQSQSIIVEEAETSESLTQNES